MYYVLATSIRESAENALKVLFDEAEQRKYDPPVPHEVIAELEYIISITSENGE